MSVLCAIGSLLWFVTFVALTGVLTGVSAAFRLMEVTITFVNPLVIFMLRVSNRLILVSREHFLSDLSKQEKRERLQRSYAPCWVPDLRMKFPCLQYLLQPQYAPYLNTAGTVLLGWLIVSWVSRIIWSFLAPLVVFVITIILICPTTVQWCIKQTVPNLEAVFHECMDMYHIFLSHIQDGPKSNRKLSSQLD